MVCLHINILTKIKEIEYIMYIPVKRVTNLVYNSKCVLSQLRLEYYFRWEWVEARLSGVQMLPSNIIL